MKYKRRTTSLGRLLLCFVALLLVSEPCLAIEFKQSNWEQLAPPLMAKEDLRVVDEDNRTLVLHGMVSKGRIDNRFINTLAAENDNYSFSSFDGDVFMLIDETSSITPAFDRSSKNRWTWIKSQMVSLSSKLITEVKGNLYLVPFADSYRIKPCKSTSEAERVIDNLCPRGSTHPEIAMKEIIKKHFDNSGISNSLIRPVLILVLTDGVCNEPDNVMETLAQATWQMKGEEEILVAFLQIANNKQGESILGIMEDETMTKYDARFKILSWRAFDEIQAHGLVKALRDSLICTSGRQN